LALRAAIVSNYARAQGPPYTASIQGFVGRSFVVAELRSGLISFVEAHWLVDVEHDTQETRVTVTRRPPPPVENDGERAERVHARCVDGLLVFVPRGNVAPTAPENRS